MEDIELAKVQESLKIMDNYVEKLKQYFNIFQTKSDLILHHMKTKYITIDEKYYESFIKRLKFKFDELKAINKDINTILANVNELKPEEISTQYSAFLIREIVNYNWNQMSYLDDNTMRNVINFTNKIDDKQIIYTNEDNQAINVLNWMMYNYQQHLDTLQSKISSIIVFDKIKDIKNNIVLIGANGSGKSTFARNFKGKLSENITILSAQHLLIYTKPDNISTNNREMNSVYSFQSSNKLGSDPNLIQLFSNDFNNLISALLVENGDREHNYYIGSEQKQNSILINAIRIWEEIIVHRRLKYSRNNIEVSTLEGLLYDFNYLSDGEKAVFYYISHVLLAKPDSYIIIDEPESHLHLAICNILWDVLEKERKDCKFIYLTHNLDFATTRNNRIILWNKKFMPPSNWDVIKLQPDECIPERLLMEIVGSRKNILFCEGDDKNSLDFKLYSILFPNYTIIPVGGHINVINYCMAYNKNKKTYGQEAIGIIDGDCHLPEQIEKWKANKIYTLRINEIENLLCDEIILINASVRFCSKENAVETFKSVFFDELQKDKERQAVWYANNMINGMFKDNMLIEKRDLNALKKELQDIINEDLVQNNYNKRLHELNDVINNKDYAGALEICDFKGKLVNYIAKEIVDNFKDRIFTLISSDNELQEKIKAKYFHFLNEQ